MTDQVIEAVNSANLHRQRSLKQENQILRGRLQSLVDQVRHNEEIFAQFQTLELELISTTQLIKLIDLLVSKYKDLFLLDTVHLTLVDNQYEIERILGDEQVLSYRDQLHFARSSSVMGRICDLGGKILVGAYRPDMLWMFPNECEPPKSVAILPLKSQGQTLGVIGVGSYSQDRFDSRAATDFLERLAAITSVCIENAINRLRLEMLGLTDSLTKISNRRFFDRRIGEEVARARRYKEALSCLFIDIDHFKNVNDTYGHLNGDQVLQQVAHSCSLQMRQTDLIARFGGEEFAVLLPKTSLEDARMVAERIRSSVESMTCDLENFPGLKVTVSLGVTTLNTSDATDTTELSAVKLLERADFALYQAKEAGRNRVHWC